MSESATLRDDDASNLENAQHHTSTAVKSCMLNSESFLREVWSFLCTQWKSLADYVQRWVGVARGHAADVEGQRRRDKDKSSKKKESWLQRRKKKDKDGAKPVGAREREREKSGAWYRPEGGLPTVGEPTVATFAIRNDSDFSDEEATQNPLFDAQNLQHTAAGEEEAGLVYVEHSGRDDDTDTQRYISSRPSKAAPPPAKGFPSRVSKPSARPPLLSQQRETISPVVAPQSTSPSSFMPRPDTTAFPTHSNRPPLLSQTGSIRPLTTHLETPQSDSDASLSMPEGMLPRTAGVWQVAPGRVLTVNSHPSRAKWDSFEPESSEMSESSDNAFET